MTKSSSNISKRSIATYSTTERHARQAKVAAHVTSSRDAAEKFLKKAGILNKKGDVSVHYRMNNK